MCSSLLLLSKSHRMAQKAIALVSPPPPPFMACQTTGKGHAHTSPMLSKKKGKRSAYVINRKDRRSKEEAGGSLCKHEAPPFGLVFGSGRMVVHRRRRLPILLLCQCNPPSSSTSSSPLSHLQKTARKKFPRGERERGGKGEKTAVGKEKEQIPPSSPDGLRG